MGSHLAAGSQPDLMAPQQMHGQPGRPGGAWESHDSKEDLGVILGQSPSSGVRSHAAWGTASRVGELQRRSDRCWNRHLEKDVGTRQVAKGKAWPDKPCDERQKGLSLAERRSKGNLSTCKSRGSFLPRWNWSCVAWEVYHLSWEHPRRVAAGNSALSVIRRGYEIAQKIPFLWSLAGASRTRTRCWCGAGGIPLLWGQCFIQ